ncbi:MAG: efflux RND transporter periplasmic adaptor subunit [Rhizobiales bacterium]|nr:efflux RND transporter periplasmic adaptor subunit [Hyphomicrobiales bacterium]
MIEFVPARCAAAVILLAVGLAGCDQPKQQQGGAPPPPAVTVANPVKRTIVDHDEYVGRFVAVSMVEMRARVSGTLDGVHFKDGQIVKEGELLFTIDRRPFQNTLDQARANLTLARSNLTYTEADLARAQQLFREKTVSGQVFDQRSQAKRNAEAEVAAQEAAVRQATLDLEFTQLRAPITGRIGDRRVAPGNLVTGGTGGNTTLLATIVTIDPIRFEFTFDEASYLRYERLSRSENTGDLTGRGGSTPVKLRLIDEQKFAHQGRMDFVDNVIDRATGTIRGRAVVANPNRLFTPGMFARVQVPASPSYEALLVPDIALGSEQVRKFVYVVDAENTATITYVTPGVLVDGLRVIKEGLAPGDRIIVNGMSRVRPGGKVDPQTSDGPPRQAAQRPPKAN